MVIRKAKQEDSKFIAPYILLAMEDIVYEKDLKFASLNEKLLKVRDKYGVDVVKYASEHSI